MTALWLVIKASALFGGAALVQAVLRRRASAAGRHLVWLAALAGALLLPVIPLVLPAWNVPAFGLPSAPAAPTVPPVAEHAALAALGSDLDFLADGHRENRDQTPESGADAVAGGQRALPAAASRASWATTVAALYAAGLFVMLLRLVLGELRLRRFVRRAAVVQDREWSSLVADAARRMGITRSTRLLLSREQTMPVALGTRAPAIVIPAVAGLWDEERRRAVVCHELAHVARHDCLAERVAGLACAVYWFHPAAWWIARRLRFERELACDDRVIAAGTEARNYAGHLLDLAYAFSGHRAPAVGVAMARRSQLEGRLAAALDGTRNRAVPRRTVRFVGLAAAVAVVCAIAAARPTAKAPEASRVANQDTIAPVLPRQLHEGGLRDAAKDVVRRFVRSVSAVVGFSQGIPGTWEVRATDQKGVVHLRIVEINSSNSTNVPIDRLEGLTETQVTGAGGPVQFRIRRDAGTFTFDGVIRNGAGAGTFSFSPDAMFPAELEKRGFARPTPSEQYQLARHDVGFAFVDELNAQGYAKPKTADLVRAGQHGVQAAYLHDMGQLGYRVRSLDDLINLRDHGVTPKYVQDLAALGYTSLPTDAVLHARDHGVTPEYVRGIREAGYGSLSMDDLVRIRDHGITPEYVRELRDAGYAALPLETLVNTRDHGVTPEYVRGLADVGFHNLPLDKLIAVRDHGVSWEYVREMRQLGHTGDIDALVNARDHGVSAEYARDMAAAGYRLPLEELVRLRDHGVTSEYAKDLKTLGYGRVDPDDLVTLRDRGLTAERIRSVNARAGTRLPIDLLKDFR